MTHERNLGQLLSVYGCGLLGGGWLKLLWNKDSRFFLSMQLLHVTLLMVHIIGYVCDALSLDPQSRCCHGKVEQYSCQWVISSCFITLVVKCIRWILPTNINSCSGCNLGLKCCNSYEYCVSCCLSPAKVFFKSFLNFYTESCS